MGKSTEMFRGKWAVRGSIGRVGRTVEKRDRIRAREECRNVL